MNKVCLNQAAFCLLFQICEENIKILRRCSASALRKSYLFFFFNMAIKKASHGFMWTSHFVCLVECTGRI